MNVNRDRLYVLALNKRFLMVAAEEANLDHTVRGRSHDFCRPVGKALLLGVDQLVERSTRLAEPILFSAVIGISVAVATLEDLSDIGHAIAQHLSGHVGSVAMN